MFIYGNIGKNSEGHLTFAGLDTVDLAAEFGTPLYLLDEDLVRERCRIYLRAMREFFGEGSLPLFASKALSFTEIYRIVGSEGIGADVVSPGELYTALRAGFDPSLICFHGNNKTDADIAYAVRSKVGLIVSDCREELEALSAEAVRQGVRQKVLLRLSPGVDAHTHAKITTGLTDSKFGVPIETGAAGELCLYAAGLPGIELIGFHSHIGSQIADVSPFREEAIRLMDFVARMRKEGGPEVSVINFGGGLGVRYLPGDPAVDYRAALRDLAETVMSHGGGQTAKGIRFMVEPGRSIVAEAGMTLYTVGSFREIPGFTPYTSVDGGMADNPRYALYESPYTVYSANRASEACDTLTHLVGRCCESGDIIQKNVRLPRPKRGDTVAVAGTGAYNYSMASNYNRLTRPPVVILTDGRARLAVRGETFEDLVRNDI